MGLTFRNPCKDCIVYSCCTNECIQYKTFMRTLTKFLPAATMSIISVTFLASIIFLYMNFDEMTAHKFLFYYQVICVLIMLYFLYKQKYTDGAIGLVILLLFSPIFGPTLVVGNIVCKCVGPVKPPAKRNII